MAIPDGYRINFETLVRAAQNGDLALMECTNKKTGKPVYVITAVNDPKIERVTKLEEPDENYEFVPLAQMFDKSPYDTLDPPTTTPDKDNHNEN